MMSEGGKALAATKCAPRSQGTCLSVRLRGVGAGSAVRPRATPVRRFGARVTPRLGFATKVVFSTNQTVDSSRVTFARFLD